MEQKNNLNNTNYICGGIAIVSFIAGVVLVITGVSPVAAILCFTLEAVVFCILCISLLKGKEAWDMNEGGDMTTKINILEQENTKNEQRIEALLREVQEKDMELLNMTKTLEEKKDSTPVESEPENHDASEALLPPIENQGNENETIDIIKIANDSIDELSGFAKKVGLTINVSTSDKSLLVRGNESRMKILFRNIIDNSIKYMNRRGSLIITISNIGDDIFIVLKDNGDGLPAEETTRIFELNYQGSNRISGNGLGLTQAKAIVDYYGGTIYAKSNVGRGMGIYIQLPTT